VTLNRREQKKEELRRDIIDASFECFATAGYHNTGIADIAAKLGIGHGTFYRYFENKRDIIGQVVDDIINRILEVMSKENAPEAADTLEGYRQQVARIGDSLVQLLSEDPRIPRVLLFEAPTVDADLRDRMLSILNVTASMTGHYLQHGVDSGYLRADLDVPNTAHAINGMMLALVLQDQQFPDENNRLRFSEAIQRLMYDGISDRGI
jgi:AcrR family transcriptional regulator